MSQRDGELTPRLRRVLREVTNEKADVFEKVAAVALTIGMVSILTVQMFWDTDNEFVHAATIHDPEIQPQLLQTLWQAASREAETVIAALAKIATVAARYGKAKAGRQVTQQWSTQAPAWPQPGKRRRANQSLRGRDTPAACAEEAKLEEALQLALSLADDIGTDSSQRLLQLRTSVVPQSEQVAILRTLFLHKARVASTLMHNIRAIARLRTWATSKGLSVATEHHGDSIFLAGCQPRQAFSPKVFTQCYGMATICTATAVAAQGSCRSRCCGVLCKTGQCPAHAGHAIHLRGLPRPTACTGNGSRRERSSVRNPVLSLLGLCVS